VTCSGPKSGYEENATLPCYVENIFYLQYLPTYLRMYRHMYALPKLHKTV